MTASTKALVPPVAKVSLRRRSASLGSIPSYCKLVYWEGVPYYYANDIYYEWNGSVGAYEQVQPPAALAENAQAPVLNRSADLFMPSKAHCKGSIQSKEKEPVLTRAADDGPIEARNVRGR